MVVSTGAQSPVGRLVACPSCHAQFDATGVRGESFLCHCGARVKSAAPVAVDAPVRRCSACGATLEAGAEKCGYCGSPVGAGAGRLVCPECFARNAGQARFCSACGVAFRPQPVLSQGDPVACPVCKTDLAMRSVAGLAVQECETCRGLWVPTANFDALVAQAREHQAPDATDGLHAAPIDRPRAANAVTYRPCPVCRQPMNRKNFARVSGVIVDWCRAHGTWLDANELEHIAAFVADGGMQRTAELEKAEERDRAAMELLKTMQAPPVGVAESDSFADLLTALLK